MKIATERPHRPIHRLALRLGALLWLSAGFVASLAATEIGPCGEGLPTARCGRLTVFEDRAAGSGRTIDLEVIVFPATDEGNRQPDPIFILAGGPGQGAASVALFIAPALADWNVKRDLVFFDQRGTGKSNGLGCSQHEDARRYFGHVFEPDHIRECRRELEQRADLRLYSTADHADDIDAVRTWLGYERINLSGGSYGTRAAQVFIRRHPEAVRTAVLDGVTPVGQRSPLSYARDAQAALDHLLFECESSEPCALAFPDARHQFRALVDRLRKGPAKSSVEASDGQTVEVEYSLGDFGYTVRGLLYNNGFGLDLPAAIDHAYRERDFAQFARAYYRRADGLAQGLAHGLYLSIMCAEEVPFIEEAQIEAASEGTFLGDYLIRDYQEACKLWPRATVADDYNDPIHSNAPILLLSGRRDPVTPPRWAETAAQGFPNSLHLVVERQGHGVTQSPEGCVLGITQEFLDQASTQNLDTTCIQNLPHPEFNLELPN